MAEAAGGEVLVVVQAFVGSGYVELRLDGKLDFGLERMSWAACRVPVFGLVAHLARGAALPGIATPHASKASLRARVRQQAPP